MTKKEIAAQREDAIEAAKRLHALATAGLTLSPDATIGDMDMVDADLEKVCAALAGRPAPRPLPKRRDADSKIRTD